MARAYSSKTLPIAASLAFAFVIVLIALSWEWPPIATEQGADVFSDGEVRMPPTSAYCTAPGGETLADRFTAFKKLAGENIFAFTANDGWKSPYGVQKGLLVLRNFSYAEYQSVDGEPAQYRFAAFANGSNSEADCYCKYVEKRLIEDWRGGEPSLQFLELPRIRIPRGFSGKRENLACCSAADAKGVTRGTVYDRTSNNVICCPGGKVIRKCAGTGACPATRTDLPSNVTFQTTRTSDNCCTAEKVTTKGIAFLTELAQYCNPNVSAAQNACHSFGSDHYGGCAMDITSVSRSCLKKAGYKVDGGSYTPGTCTWEDDHYHCTFCNSGGPGTPGYDDDGNY